MIIIDENKTNFSKYMNFLMSKVYQTFLKQSMPRVIPLMKEILQFSLEKRIGDCFLMEEGILIRTHGFVHPPYVLPTLLAPRIFSLEMIRQKFIVENEHFINLKNSYEIKFPWVIGPFIIKSRAALLVVENLLK